MSLQLSESYGIDKAILIGLNDGISSITQCNVWAAYDEETMRMSLVWSGGDFLRREDPGFASDDMSKIYYDGDVIMESRDGTGWAKPGTQDFSDSRILPEKKLYGSLPSDRFSYDGIYHYNDSVILTYTVGEARIFEEPSAEFQDSNAIITRTINTGSVREDLYMYIAPLNVQVGHRGDGELITLNGKRVLKISASEDMQKSKLYVCNSTEVDLDSYIKFESTDPELLKPKIFGGENNWSNIITVHMEEDMVDVPLPEVNPWNVPFIATGISYYRDKGAAVVTTWNGDLWELSGVSEDERKLNWRRIASGLYQPRSIAIRNGKIFVDCRNQIVCLHDLNQDGLIDYYQNISNEHNISEHFHEFELGLQFESGTDVVYTRPACETQICGDHPYEHIFEPLERMDHVVGASNPARDMIRKTK